MPNCFKIGPAIFDKNFKVSHLTDGETHASSMVAMYSDE